jgi:site-specific DNA-cytosine methylase
MRVLVACEYSGAVRDALINLGHDAVSCDLLPTDVPGPHHQGSVLDILDDGWDMMIAFPPCTHLAVSGARWFAAKRADGRQQQGIDFFMALANANIPKIAIENPVGIMSTEWRKPDQIIQPWQYGHEATKTTCLWLKGLPKLTPTNVVGKGARHVTKSGRSLPEWYNLPPSEDRWKIRSKTFQGIADAMAQQWGGAK